MPARLATLVALGALALALAACGGNGDAAETAPPETAAATTEATTTDEAAPGPEPTEVEEGLLYEVPDAGFAVAVPRRWVARTRTELPDERALVRFSWEHGDISGYFEPLTQETPIEFVAADPRVRSGFATNLTVLVQELEPGTDVAAYAAQAVADIQATGANLRGEVSTGAETLPAGEAATVTYEREVVVPEETLVLETRHYLLVEDGRGYALTFATVTPGARSEQILRRALASFRFL